MDLSVCGNAQLPSSLSGLQTKPFETASGQTGRLVYTALRLRARVRPAEGLAAERPSHSRLQTVSNGLVDRRLDGLGWTRFGRSSNPNHTENQ